MKIGIVIHRLDPQRGGAELWTMEFIKRLLARGYKTHVVSTHFAETTLQHPFIPHRVQAGWSRIAFAAAAEALLKTLDLDVIHDMGMGWYGDVYQSHGGAWRAATEAKTLSLPPLLQLLKWTTLSWLPRYRTFSRLTERQLADPRRIVLCVSQMVADDFQKYHGVRQEQIRVVYNGVDTERFSPSQRLRYRAEVRSRYNVREEEILFLFVGNDYHRKGLPYVFQALKILLNEGAKVRLLVVGGKPYRRLAYLWRGSRLRSAVVFTGLIADPVPCYAAADAFVLPTLYDPCSLSVLEAAACGLPSITTRRNGASELITEDREGLILEKPWDPEPLTAAMRTLLDGEVRRRLGGAARKKMLQFTFERNCEEITQIYHEIRRFERCAA